MKTKQKKLVLFILLFTLMVIVLTVFSTITEPYLPQWVSMFLASLGAIILNNLFYRK